MEFWLTDKFGYDEVCGMVDSAIKAGTTIDDVEDYLELMLLNRRITAEEYDRLMDYATYWIDKWKIILREDNKEDM